MSERKQTVFDDFKSAKGYVIGILGLAATVALALTQYFGLPPVPTWMVVFCVVVALLFIGFLIYRSENRQIARLNSRVREENIVFEKLNARLDYLAQLGEENQKSSLRTEMNQMINAHPENHDTILKYAQKYFGEYNGDWVETDIFMGWAEEESARGRKVHIPLALQTIITAKVAEEKLNEKQLN